VHTGIYFDLRNPPQWASDPARLYAFTLEMCEEADRLGCHSIWVSEHHGFDDGYLPQPLTMAAAIAARTKHARIGTAIMIAPLHHPVSIAEQAAIVDLVSEGRLDLGLGAGYRVPEFAMFDADISHRYTTTDERVRAVRRLWTDGPITPRPVQQRVPIWLGYQGPQGARRAGRLGEHLLSMDPVLWPIYRDALVEAGHDPAAARMAGGLSSWVSEDPEADWPTVAKHLSAQMDSYRRYMVEGTDQPVPRPVDPDRLRDADPTKGSLRSFILGTPEAVAARVRAVTSPAPVETVFFWASIAGMPEPMVAAHVRTICTGLAPLLVDSPVQMS
jgi:alkanesulfonate monooxygenase SsuD/methylene tetrahydromethanopterin reductase-like flavin-dependent oxidoreductase (luciferase family)